MQYDLKFNEGLLYRILKKKIYLKQVMLKASQQDFVKEQ